VPVTLRERLAVLNNRLLNFLGEIPRDHAG
jgi:hypothetical protein